MSYNTLNSYENFRRVAYGGLQFIPVCSKCGRFVKADDSVEFNGLDEYIKQPNATCKKCGRIEMPCEGYF